MPGRDGYLTSNGLQPSDFQAAWDAISAARRIVALTHANPDADAVASLLAMVDALKGRGREVQAAVGDGTLPENLHFLPGADLLSAPATVRVDGVDLLLVVDCADLGRLGPLQQTHPEWFDGHIPIVNIDHHVTNTRFGTVNLVDPDAAATCELLGLLFVLLGLPLPIGADVATCLLAGIQGDTLGLRTPSTTSRTLRVAADLLERGADLDTIVDYLFRVKPFSTVKLWGLVLARAEMLEEVVWTEITQQMLQDSGALASEGEGIVNFLTGTRGAQVGVLFYEQPDGWRVSLRSIRDDVDVAELARLYGGGGHSRAAGCRLDPGIPARDRFLADIAARLSAPRATAPTPSL